MEFSSAAHALPWASETTNLASRPYNMCLLQSRALVLPRSVHALQPLVLPLQGCSGVLCSSAAKCCY